MQKNNYFVYIISNWNNKVIYVGVTNNLERRLYEHKNKLFDGFSKRYNLTKLVYFEQTSDIKSAIHREKEIKKWRREKKNQLIEVLNPKWEELFEDGKRKISQSSEKTTFLRNDKSKITGLIISAGLSSRMGKFKPIILLNGKSFLENIIINLQPICKNIIIVTGHNSEKIEKHIAESEHVVQNNIQLIYNPNYEKGMFTSLQSGLSNIDKNNWVLYHLVDQPNLPGGFYKEFVKQVSNEVDWIQPIFNNRKGHPILFNSKVINSILDADDSENLRTVSSSIENRKKYWECDYKEVLSDFDTPKDLKKLKD